MTFTVVGAYTGQVYGIGKSLVEAAGFAWRNGYVNTQVEVERALEGLAVREAWKSHVDARGIKITRTA